MVTGRMRCVRSVSSTNGGKLTRPGMCVLECACLVRCMPGMCMPDMCVHSTHMYAHAYACTSSFFINISRCMSQSGQVVSALSVVHLSLRASADIFLLST